MKEKTRSLITALVLIGAAIAFIASPVSSMAIVLRIVGALILAWEGFLVIRTLKILGARADVLIHILLSNAFLIICALLLLVNPESVMKILSLGIGLYLVITAGVTLFGQFSSHIRPSFSATLVTVVSLLLGVWLIVSPFDITRLTSIFVGVAVLLKGLGLLLETLEDDDDGNGDDFVTDDFVDKSNEL